jgi:molybdenum cofactor cytidylyltransferase
VKFGALSLDQAEGAVLAHSVRVGKIAYKKGRALSAADVEALRAAGVDEVIAAKLEPDDVEENEAARLVATAIAGEHVRIDKPFTGRVNLFAEQPGLLVLDRERIDRLNRLDEAVTLATLAGVAEVQPKHLVATA